MLKNGFLAAICVVISVAGCSKAPPPLPPTHSVHGRVTYANGEPVVDGLVQFRSDRDRSVITSGVIRKDGTYSLVTSRDGLRADGAVAGPHNVLIIVTSKASGDPKSPMLAVPPIMVPLPKTYNVETRDNEFKLVVGQP
jgi:hypothetical protein